MKVTMLGCGSSPGVPLIGCKCAVCISPDPKNQRSRVSILVEDQGTRILIDTSPDLRTQALRQDLDRVDAILYTHAHADHTHGIDDVRGFNVYADKPIDCYADKPTLDSLKGRFSYAFEPPVPAYGWFRPCLVGKEISPDLAPFAIGSIRVEPFIQHHGKHDSLGYRFGNFAYSTDTNGFPEDSWAKLTGLDVWIVDCLRIKPAPTHAHLDLSLEWIARAKPKRAILTHMGHEFDYQTLSASLPDGVEPGYDGLSFEIQR